MKKIFLKILFWIRNHWNHWNHSWIDDFEITMIDMISKSPTEIKSFGGLDTGPRNFIQLDWSIGWARISIFPGKVGNLLFSLTRLLTIFHRFQKNLMKCLNLLNRMIIEFYRFFINLASEVTRFAHPWFKVSLINLYNLYAIEIFFIFFHHIFFDIIQNFNGNFFYDIEIFCIIIN